MNGPICHDSFAKNLVRFIHIAACSYTLLRLESSSLYEYITRYVSMGTWELFQNGKLLIELFWVFSLSVYKFVISLEARTFMLGLLLGQKSRCGEHTVDVLRILLKE